MPKSASALTIGNISVPRWYNPYSTWEDSGDNHGGRQVHHQSSVFKLSVKNFLRDPVDASLQLIESPWTLFQIAQKQEFPFSANQGYCCCNRTFPGSSSFVRISVTSVYSIAHSFLSVQLQKGAYLFECVASILSSGNERLQIKLEVLTMASYTKMTVGKENETELHEKLALTGAEISLNTLACTGCVC